MEIKAKKSRWLLLSLLPLLLGIPANTMQAQTRRKATTAKRPANKIRSLYQSYKGYDPSTPAGKPVDLGLSVMWSDRNVGATSATDYGGLFRFGNINGNVDLHYTQEEYPHQPSIVDTKYDVAHIRWGDGWRMPTKKELIELFSKCKYAKVTGPDGYPVLRLIGPNGNSILLPTAGYIKPLHSTPPCRESISCCYFWAGETSDGIGWGHGKDFKISGSRYAPPLDEYGTAVSIWGADWGLSHPDINDVTIGKWEMGYALAVRPVKDGHQLKPIYRPSNMTPQKKQGTTAKPANSAHWTHRKKNTPSDTTPTGKGNATTPTGKGSTQSSQSSTTYVTDCGGPAENTPKKTVTKSQSSTVKIVTDCGGKPVSGKNTSNTKKAPIPTHKPPRPNPNPWPKKNESAVIERAVDLGLSVFWSDRNVGAESISDPGAYYMWSISKEMEKKKQQTDLSAFVLDVANISGTQYDMASRNWGNRWRLPTDEEIKELIENCTLEQTSINGQRGIKVTGKNKHWIFIPYGGACSPLSGQQVKDCGIIWSANASESDSYEAKTGLFYGERHEIKTYIKALLCNVRAVTTTMVYNKPKHPDSH